MRIFPFNIFYVYDDDLQAEQHLLSKCSHTDLISLSNIAFPSTSISILQMNWRSIFSKQHDIDLFIHSTSTLPSICCFTETYLSDAIPSLSSQFILVITRTLAWWGGGDLHSQLTFYVESFPHINILSFEYITFAFKHKSAM